MSSDATAPGPEDQFGRAASVVEWRADLDHAAATLPGAPPVHAMADEPGGGYRVAFKDPVDGLPFHLVYGQAPVTAPQSYPTLFPCLTRLHPAIGPAPVHKFGHFGMCVTDFAAAYRFYTTRFNFVSSDVVYDDTDTSRDHYVDGDLVNRQCKPNRSQASPDGLHIWGARPDCCRTDGADGRWSSNA
ncbi:hypothetical protein SPBR_06082 [Sporothrix brasiliensis 5110]|uniref:VOC domain-containing protein n=1 Tax=Sporothrix brasiliensis 5110 TaxID=1398154 RepID=A0A0C2FU38_9PEZI|nr:uncharacterized protein SPBR_06082 [Sporothrix brasiliensis 5110]KIH94523.1 hypothetical protein SPBR_06082 [Sporothrix brasiliensis 5110]